jgi:hypothetical protein
MAACLESQSAQRTAEAWRLLPPLQINPLTARGRRYWSQSNEDGILEEVLQRTGPLNKGRFIELGVGDGTENNTVALLARGWDGIWAGGEPLAFEPVSFGRLEFRRAWITLQNINEIIPTRFVENTDVISIDLDGNDYHFAERLLKESWRPKVWIVEYNARFPVGTHWVMPYEAAHCWDGSDYFGASLSAFVELFRQFDYRLVACSAQGANAFFIDLQFDSAFADVPIEEELLYRPPAYFLSHQWGHQRSPALVRSLTRPDGFSSPDGGVAPRDADRATWRL